MSPLSAPEKSKKTVLIAGHTQIACTNFTLCIQTVLGDYVEPVAWHIGSAARPPAEIETADLILATTKNAYDLCRAYCPQETPLLLAERVLGVQRLDELLPLDESTRAYVAGSSYETAIHTINLLRDMGFSRLPLVPYYAGMPERVQPDITVAITPGLSYIVPPHATHVINVGAKEVAISTLAEILRCLDIPISVLNKISGFYIRSLLANTRERSLMGIQNQALNNQLQTILNTVQEAIVALDEGRRIVVYNHAAEKIFSVPIATALGADGLEITALPLLLECMESGERASRVLFIDGQHYLVMADIILNHTGAVGGVVATFHPAEAIKELENQVRRELGRHANVARYSFKDIRGSSPALQKAVSLAAKFAASELTILLEGESGTGKELFAQAIHERSTRRSGPFVAINFAAIPDNLVESELFGYEDGAFTGARRGGRRGLFEEAHRGTIFLDEIGSATPEVQNRLLRVLEEREIRRLGSSKNTPVDVRVIAATNIHLEELVARKVFREDLYYRLCVLPISIPPLRTRKTDIVRLAKHFTQNYAEGLEFSSDILDTLLRYTWPGNIRELQNVIKYLCSVVEPGRMADTSDLPPYLLRKLERAAPDGERREGPNQDTAGHKTPGRETSGRATRPEGSGDAAPPPPVFEEGRGPGLRRTMTTILAEIRDQSAASRSIGYSRLLARLKTRLPGLSAYYVKKCLRELKELGCVATGKTKQGSYITEKGIALLETLHDGGE